MKPLFINLTFVLFFFFFNGFAQNENWNLFPENGKEYIYDFTESSYVLDDQGNKLNEFYKKKKLRIQFETSKTDGKEYLNVSIIKSIAAKPQSNPPQFTDYRFPYFRDGTENWGSSYYEELLCQVLFRYEFDFETSKIKLANRDEVLLKVHSVFKQKGFDKKSTTVFNKIIIPQITKNIQLLYQVPGNKFEEKINPTDYKIEINTKVDTTLIKAKRWDRVPGLYSREININNKEKRLTSYNEVLLDSAKARVWNKDKFIDELYYEKNIQLDRIRNTGLNRFSVSGEVQNLKFKKITLSVLRKPYGFEFNQQSVFLDDNNTFHFEAEINHPGIVFLQLGQVNRAGTVFTIPFYAEPGCEIQINADCESNPVAVKFNGDFAPASEMLFDFIYGNNLGAATTVSSNGFNFNRFEYADYYKAVESFNSFLQKHQNKVDQSAFNFLTNELNALLISGKMNYLNNIKLSDQTNYGRFIAPDLDKIDITWLAKVQKEKALLENYNEYGIYSRLAANDYLRYHSNSAPKIADVQFLNFNQNMVVSNYNIYGDLPFSVEFSKTVLAGHALYNQLVSEFQRRKISSTNSGFTNDIYLYERIDTYISTLLRLCNDDEFNEAVQDFYKNHLNWEDSTYVPSNKFFNAKAEPVFLKDYFGERTTIFYVSNGWGNERYSFDDLAKENPDINYVMVMEGNNFQEWSDYLKRAEPIADQLLLINPEQQLIDIFKKNLKHFIIYNKNGERLAFSNNAQKATNLAKQFSNSKKKALNKSQLQLIVIILFSLLIFLISVLFLWKWRVRQRFRKEEQSRKLRELELTAIRSQMNPHFLFNSLNSVQNLVQQNKGREAHLYLSDFAGLIRKVLRNSEKEEVSLAEELEMTEQYLNLEKLRFDFNFTITLDEKIDSFNTLVPSMILQPFAENAVIHGLQNKPENRELKIEIQKTESGIKINIEDNGIGREAAKEIAKAKNGLGTKMIRERLKILQEKQGEKYKLQIVDLKAENETGTRVEIFIPEEK